MNPRIISFSLASLKAGILFAILLSSILVARSSWITSDPMIGTAITIDLLFSIPIVYYFFIRHSAIPKITVVPVFGLGVISASLLLPEGERQLLDLAILYAVPLVEISVLGYLAYRVYRTRTAFMAEAGRGRDLMERLRAAFEREIKPPFVARIAAFELGLFYYSLFRWRPKRDADSFTYHRKNGSILLLMVFLFLLMAETVVVHILAAQWNSVVAWVLTAASIYFGLQIVAHLKAMFVRPVQITDTELLIRCGAFGDTAIELDSIRNIRVGAAISEAGVIKLGALGDLSEANMTLDLDRDATLNGYYGLAKTFQSISFFVDEPALLADRLRERMNGE